MSEAPTTTRKGLRRLKAAAALVANDLPVAEHLLRPFLK